MLGAGEAMLVYTYLYGGVNVHFFLCIEPDMERIDVFLKLRNVSPGSVWGWLVTS